MESVGDLERLARSFERHLRAENKALKTVVTYGEAIGQLTSHLLREGVTDTRSIGKEQVETFI